jgi:hypothetical protein
LATLHIQREVLVATGENYLANNRQIDDVFRAIPTGLDEQGSEVTRLSNDLLTAARADLGSG